MLAVLTGDIKNLESETYKETRSNVSAEDVGSELSAVETVELVSESDDDDDVPEETLAEGLTNSRFNARTHPVLAAAVSTAAPNS